jgi:hypothetical protein
LRLLTSRSASVGGGAPSGAGTLTVSVMRATAGRMRRAARHPRSSRRGPSR